MTATELIDAAAPLWARGYTARQIAEMLGANRERMKSLAKRHRDRFPYRYGRKGVRMSPTEKYKRAESLFNERTKRELADMVVHREADLDDLRGLVRDALACVRESSRGFQTHPKAYRDLRSRAKKLGVDE